MERRRNDVLIQALNKNADETARWQAYKADNEAAINNLDMFAKQLTVEVMVPIGKKALMPGELIHTNELLVGHYQGYFSACSSHKAKQICQHRLRIAVEQLKKLEVEEKLWQDKLEAPMAQGAVPNAGEVEIVEDFDQTTHEEWLISHRESVRKQKQTERMQREAATADEDVFEKLELHEMLEELGIDEENLNEQALNGMISTESKAPLSEIRNTHKAMSDEEVLNMLEKLEQEEQNEESEINTEIEENLKETADMVRNLMSNPDTNKKGKMERTVEEPTVEHEDNNSVDDEEQLEEVRLIRNQLALLPSEEREEFLVTQIQVIKAKMRKMQKVNFISDELTHLMDVVVCLEDDWLEMQFEMLNMDKEELAEEEEDTVATDTESVSNNKRRISFAKSDEQLEFNKHQSVDKLLKQKKRDVIILDESTKQTVKTKNDEEKQQQVKSTNPQIMDKVQQNLEFVKEHQSVQDFDLVNQILEAATGVNNTLHISFKHSEALAAPSEPNDEDIPGTPADFYKLYEKALAAKQSEHAFPIYVNGFEGEQELRVPMMKEEERAAAYDDPRAEFSKPPADSDNTKSILRNKSAVELETRAHVQVAKENKTKNNKKQKKTQRTLDDELRDMSAYQKVMQEELLEKEPTAPEPLPAGKFIDAHAPKKRVSRFKQMRAESKT
ncbi:uri [Drosophila busckii]|uniref:Uri n=1 Tax=Drosophila busckii TaxID=30019 RepID=A0A0M4EI85_DROBS|nr:unconventional prefoldin RPB5 interactor-like protein [Drosophila busckii]ALC40755.1 uri [Drosophila busckii]